MFRQCVFDFPRCHTRGPYCSIGAMDQCRGLRSTGHRSILPTSGGRHIRDAII